MTFNVNIQTPRGMGPRQHMNILDGIAQWSAEMQVLVRDALKAEAPVNKSDDPRVRPGRLRDSIRSEDKTTGDGVTITFVSHVPYAKYVIDGTKAHDIEVKAARWLYWQKGGVDHFAKKVHHPEVAPNDFPERALRPLESEIKRRLTEIMRERLGGS